MRPPILSALGACVVLAGLALAQNTGDSDRNAPTLPVGQTFKQFTFPVYQDGQLKYTLFATEATGITLNRAETANLKIDVYDNGQKTTTITSPKADLYVSEQKMRTKNTVEIERDDMNATSQDCDFNVKTKQFLLRTHVKVLLKHFDVGGGTNPTPTSAGLDSTPARGMTAPDTTPVAPAPADGSILLSPGAYSDTNAAPLPAPGSMNK
jgi:hypothetical protein